jgi:N-acyl-D-aspartate/D-glutamate deacylase
MSRAFSRSCCLLLAGLVATACTTQYDVVIRNGRVVDGTGTPWYYADVAISGDRIVAVGDLADVPAGRVIDATGLYVAPGFIDTHSHSGPALATEELSHAQPLLAQGITTVFVNPDGGGPIDLAQQRTALLANGLGVNVAQYVGHGSIRREVLGTEDRGPTAEELDRMKSLVRAGMEEGAFGLSSGLFYVPGSYAPLEEVIEMAKVASEFNGTYHSHVRDESDYNIGLVAAVDEVIRVAREAELPGVVTHIKALGPRVWGLADTLVAHIEQARAEGVEVFADQYPYTASSTGLGSALLPRWSQVGGRDSLIARINDPEVRRRLVRDMVNNLDRRGGAGRIQFQRYEPDPSIEGKTLHDVANERGLNPIDAALALIEGGNAGIVSHNMQDSDVERLMVQPWAITCTDGGLVPMGQGVPHPRSYGTYPRKIRKYVVEDGVLGLAEAIRGMTSMPAAVFRVADRGIVREGSVADLIVFDLANLGDKATYQDPHQLSEGMVYVLVNGQVAVDNEEFSEGQHGKVLSSGQ